MVYLSQSTDGSNDNCDSTTLSCEKGDSTGNNNYICDVKKMKAVDLRKKAACHAAGHPRRRDPIVSIPFHLAHPLCTYVQPPTSMTIMLPLAY